MQQHVVFNVCTPSVLTSTVDFVSFQEGIKLILRVDQFALWTAEAGIHIVTMAGSVAYLDGHNLYSFSLYPKWGRACQA
jgi:hypothetical protein